MFNASLGRKSFISGIGSNFSVVASAAVPRLKVARVRGGGGNIFMSTMTNTPTKMSQKHLNINFTPKFINLRGK